VIGLHPFNELFRRGVHFFRLDERFRRATPAGDQPRNTRSLAEVGDVFLDLQSQFVLILALLDVRAVDQFHEIVIERRFHGLDGREERLHFLQVLGIQHAPHSRQTGKRYP